MTNQPTIEVYPHRFNVPGYVTAKLPDDVVKTLKEEVAKIISNLDAYEDVDIHVAGHLQYHRDMMHCGDLLKPYLIDMIDAYGKHFEYLQKRGVFKTFKPLELKDLWVNFQRKHDFNPIHDHRGILSFVIWLNIPYDINEELKLYKNGGRASGASTFEFAYTDSLGDICNHSIPVSKEWEGVIAMWPAQMKHLVHPFFTSDEYRVSIAGNIDY